MRISEAKKASGLTKKAIEYYTEQNLVHPAVLENGYRDFSEADISRLKQISVLRRLGLGTEEIRSVFSDNTRTALGKLSVRKELKLRTETTKKSLLEALAHSGDFPETDRKLKVLDENTAIAERLLDTFPGYFGKFICLHFAAFLNEPARTTDQNTAYQEVVSFLDNIPATEFPREVQEFLDENTGNFSAANICAITNRMRNAADQPDHFLNENKEFLESYFSVRFSEEYINSPAGKSALLLRQFLNASGYYDRFLPAMERLSPSYARYRQQLALADQAFSTHYPSEYRKILQEHKKSEKI